jgi:ATP-dependent protease ClpP protease subunit
MAVSYADTIEKFRELGKDAYPRKVLISGKITGEQLLEAKNKIEAYINESSDPIVLLLDSNGGHYGAAVAFCEFIEDVQSKGAVICGHVKGVCYSSTFLLLQACNIRFASTGSKLLLHNNYTIPYFQIGPDTDPEVIRGAVEQEVRVRNAVREKALDFLERRIVAQTREEILSLMKQGKIMTAASALDWGAIDAIVE